MIRRIFATLSLLACLSPSWAKADEPTTGENVVTDCRFESDLKAKSDMEYTQDTTTKETKGSKDAVNGT